LKVHYGYEIEGRNFNELRSGQRLIVPNGKVQRMCREKKVQWQEWVAVAMIAMESDNGGKKARKPSHIKGKISRVEQG
jgi:hypothetical protein